MRSQITLVVLNMRMRLAEPTKWDSFTVSAQVLLIWVVTPAPPLSFSVSWYTFTSTTPLCHSQLHSCLERPVLACQQALLNPQPHPPFNITRTHILRALFLSPHWSVTEATWQVTHTLDVIGSGPEIQPLEWWETVTRIVYLRYRRGERGVTEKEQALLSFFAMYHSRGKERGLKKGQIFLPLRTHATCWKTSDHDQNLRKTNDNVSLSGILLLPK